MQKALPCFQAESKENFYFDLFKLSDGQLQTDDGHFFHIHKLQLAIKSDYFYRLFCGDAWSHKDVFLIPGVKGDVMKNILTYIYTGNLSITEENVCDILIAADYLLVDELILHIKSVCDKLSVKNCLPLFIAAMQINRTDILRDTTRYIQTHFGEVATNEDSEIGQLPVEVFKLFLGDRNICARDENQVWLAICKWVQTEINDRLHFVPDLLTYLAVPDIDEELATKILEHVIVYCNPFCREIWNLKQLNPLATNLKIFLTYVEKQSNAALPLNTKRLPKYLYFIAHYCVYNQTDGIRTYISYDEKIDLWRKIGEADVCPDFILSIGCHIYMFKTDESKILSFNLFNREWHEMPQFGTLRNYYGVVALDESIYVLGGISPLSGNGLTVVEVYDTTEHSWYHASSMLPVYSFNAVGLENRIYVVGNVQGIIDYEMTAQIYDPETDEWQFIEAPSIYRFKASLIVYKGKIYLIGGRDGIENLTDVEVYDPVKQEWSLHRSLPYIFYSPKAVVLNDKLIVYDNHLEDRKYLKTNPAVVWEEDLKNWRSYEETSPMNSIHEYGFVALDDRMCIKIVSAQNRDPNNQFQKSPFN